MKTDAPDSVKPTDTPNALGIVLQWVTYVLWELSLGALSILLTATLSYFFIYKTGDYGFVAYVLAALICLLPLAIVSDKLYARREPAQKHGFAAVVLVLNAVVVFVAVLTGLITAVVSILSLVVDATPSNGKHVVIAASLIVTLLGALLFVRVINLPRLAKLTRLYTWAVLGVSVLALLFAIGGPVKTQVQTRNDRLIEDNLSTIATAVQTYAGDHNGLPASLHDVSIDPTYNQGAQALIDRGMVAYHPSGHTTRSSYQLCVTYHKAKGTGSFDSAGDSNGYIDTTSHGAGYHCYTLNTSSGIIPL